MDIHTTPNIHPPEKVPLGWECVFECNKQALSSAQRIVETSEKDRAMLVLSKDGRIQVWRHPGCLGEWPRLRR